MSKSGMNKELRILRLTKRVSQFKLAVATGISQTRISYFENGLLELKSGEVEKIREVLGQSETSAVTSKSESEHLKDAAYFVLQLTAVGVDAMSGRCRVTVVIQDETSGAKVEVRLPTNTKLDVLQTIDPLLKNLRKDLALKNVKE